MSRNYYIFRSGRIRRQDNTIYVETDEGKKPIPVEDIDSLYLFGELDLNTKFLNFISQKNVPAHFFNYYGFYSGSFYPREYLNSGFLLVRQVEHYSSPKRRIAIAREICSAAAHNIVKNLAYYESRAADAESVGGSRRQVEEIAARIPEAKDVSELMGIEGNVRERYYAGWSSILGADVEFEKRVRRPPDNLVNALISFGNSMMYSTALSEIYRTQLNPTVSYLHEPGERRFSLALDLAEIFKPIIVDRLIFSLINTRQIRPEHAEEEVNYCYLKEEARKLFVRGYEEKLQTSIKHRRLKRNVTYQHLIRLECYRLVKHLTAVEPYEAFRGWW
ncbi:MAG: type I-B CRISPR-associated endonuclease Cas1b [Armatimonadota bacterium]|nr:type I-B CRISPR-associated endonuclease Cas1b [Armatimonadota bacterium]